LHCNTEGSQVVVGTPDIIDNLIKRGVIDTRKLKIIVLDEADESFKGYHNQIKAIFMASAHNTRAVVFSVTTSSIALFDIINTNSNRNPIMIEVDSTRPVT